MACKGSFVKECQKCTCEASRIGEVNSKRS